MNLTTLPGRLNSLVHSLFFKLFLGFWLTMVLGGTVSMAAMMALNRLSLEGWQSEFFRSMDARLVSQIDQNGRAALAMYDCGGYPAYLDFIGELERGTGIRVRLVGEDGLFVGGQPLNTDEAALFASAVKDDALIAKRYNERLMVARPLPLPLAGSGAIRKVAFLAEHRGLLPSGGPPPGMESGERWWYRYLPPFFHRGEWPRTLVMLLVVSVLCSLLARSLTAPVRQLQQATRRIAKGDYSVRTGLGLTRRSDEIGALGRDFDRMVERTEKLLHARDRLVRDISHELRSPLARLNVALELARSRLQPKDDSSLDKIGKEADRLNELIGELLILARLESGAPLTDVDDVNLHELIWEVAEDVAFEAGRQKKGVAVFCDCEVTLFGSHELLHRAVENIVRNAAQYTRVNTSVEIRLEDLGDQVCLEVSDYGDGVDEQHLGNLFQPFYRVAEGRERQSGGAGIGLAIAEQAVTSHGGTIVAINGTEDRGLIVRVLLPKRFCFAVEES